jgi:hypothetical protein
MSVSIEEIERRRRLAELTAQETDPSDITGLAPPPTAPPKSQRLETQQAPDRRAPRDLGTYAIPEGHGASRSVQLTPPPEAPKAINFDEIAQRAKGDSSRFDEIHQRARKEAADATAGRIETAASQAGEAFTGMLGDLPKGIIRGVVAERQGQGIADKLGLQWVAEKTFGRPLTDEELDRVLPAIETNPVTKWLDKTLDFNLGSNPEYLSNPDEEFSVANFFNDSVPSAIGSMSAFALAGLLTKGAVAAGGGGALASTVAGGVSASALGAITGGEQTASGVAAKGGTNEEIINAFVLGNLPGLTEGAPIGRALNRLDKGSGGRISRSLKEGFKGSVEELIQEGIQGASTKYIENAILDLDQDLFDRSTKEGAAAGGVAGFLTSFLLTALGGRRAGNRRDGPAGRAESEASGQQPPAQPEEGQEGERETPPPGQRAADQPGDVSGDTMFGAVQPEQEQEDVTATPEQDVPAPEETQQPAETYEFQGKVWPIGTQMEGESDEAFSARQQLEQAQIELGTMMAGLPEGVEASQLPQETVDAMAALAVNVQKLGGDEALYTGLMSREQIQFLREQAASQQGQQPQPEGVQPAQPAPEPAGQPEPAQEAQPQPEPAPAPQAEPQGAPEAETEFPNYSNSQAETDAQQGLPTQTDEELGVTEIVPETPEQSMEAANRLLGLGAQMDAEGSPQSLVDVPPIPGRDRFSDNEQDHQEALAAFIQTAEQAGWQLAGQSNQGTSFGYLTPSGDRVQVYKIGAGMGYNLALRPSERDWSKSTAVVPPNVDPNLRTQGQQGAAAPAAPGTATQPQAAPELDRVTAYQVPGKDGNWFWRGEMDGNFAVVHKGQQKELVKPADLAPQAQPEPEPAPAPPPIPEPETTTAELPPVATAVQPAGTQEGRHTVQTAAGERVETQFAVVDQDDLITSDREGFTKALQPRERGTRQSLQEQIKKIIREFDPRQIAGPDPTAAAGSPIINDRGEVISGNGRVTALREIFANKPELAEQYRSYVKDTLGIDLQPGQILVQSVAQPMTAQQQRAFVDQANVSQQAKLSPAEQARTDARAIDEALASRLQPMDVANAGNADFVRGFVQSMQNRGEDVGAIVQSDGTLSAAGKARIENAILARALGATDQQVTALERTLEDPDNNTKSITGAVLDAAQNMLNLQLAAESGNVDQNVAGQIAPALTTAIDQLSQIRRNDALSVEEFLNQQDAFTARDPLVDEFLRSFVSPDLSRPASRQNIAQILRQFADALSQAANTAQADMLGGQGPVNAAQVLRAAREQTQGVQSSPSQAGLFGAGGNPFAGQQQQQPAAEPAAQPQPAPQGTPSPAAAPGVTNVKRAESFETDGAYDVVTPNGRTVQIFRDTEQFGSPVWHLVDDGNILGIPDGLRNVIQTQGIGSTQAEAIGWIEQMDDKAGPTAASAAGGAVSFDALEEAASDAVGRTLTGDIQTRYNELLAEGASQAEAFTNAALATGAIQPQEAVRVYPALEQLLKNEQQQPNAAPNVAPGVAPTEQQQADGATTGANRRNAGTTAPTTGTPVGRETPEAVEDPQNEGTEGIVSGQQHKNKPPQAEKSSERQTAPGTVSPGDQNNVENQKKQSYEQNDSPLYNEKAAILGNDLIDQMEKDAVLNDGLSENHPNISTVAIRFNKELIKNRSIQLIGTVVQTAKDFAKIAQVWRDPQFETFRYIFTDANGKIIFQTGVSTRLPDATQALPTGHGWGWLGNMMSVMSAAGATKVWLQHNHPSGTSKASSADKKTTKHIGEYAQRHGLKMEHVIINSNEYTVIKSTGSTQTFKDAGLIEGGRQNDPLLQPPEGMAHDLLDVELKSALDLAKAGKAIQTADNVTLIATDAGRRVVAIGEMSWDTLNNLPPKQLAAQIENWRRQAGALYVTMAGLPVDLMIFPQARRTTKSRIGKVVSAAEMKKLNPLGDKLHKALTRTGVVRDVIDTNGESALYQRQFVIATRGKKRSKEGQGGDVSAYQVYEEGMEPTLEGDSEAVRRQREVVANVRSGQPLDRLFRWMFTGFGIFEDRLLKTNDAGEDPQFRHGAQAVVKLTYWLQDTWFPTDTNDASTETDEEGRQPYAPGRIRSAAYAYGNRFLKRARWGLIDRYGLPEGVLTLDERRFRERVTTLSEGVEQVKKMVEMGVDSFDEAVLLQRYLTGEASEEAISDKEWASVAEEVRASLDHLGMEAVGLGLISRESYERNKGTYLHRAYYTHEGLLEEQGGALGKWIGQNVRGAGRGIKGDAFKGRGIFMELTQKQLLKDVPRDLADSLGWGQPITSTTGRTDNVLLNQRFAIYDVLVDENATEPLAPGIPAGATPTQIKRRIYWPADQDVPATFGNYEYRGDFLVRNVKGKKFTLWRDYNADERAQMGEILDARYNIIKTFQLLSRDLANGKFYRSIALNPEWTWDESIHGTIPPELVAPKGAQEGVTGGGRLSSYIDYEWVQVPNTPVSGTRNNVKKWGDLAGRYVRAEVWKDISEIGEMQQPRMWTRLLTEWKLNKTARNPVVHMNNIMSNFALMDLLDIRVRDLVEGTMMRLAPLILENPKLQAHHAFFERYANPELLAEIRANGGFGHSLIDVEVTKEVIDPVMKELRDVMGQVESLDGTNSMRLTARFLKILAQLWGAQTELYRMEDEFFRAATVIRKLGQGYSMAESAKMAREQFLNYDIRAPWINAGRRSILPFISYTYRAVPAITDAIMRRPWKLAKYVMVAEVANAMAYAVSGGDEEYERGSLRKEVKGDISFGLFPGGVPRMIRLPSNDQYGRPEFLDIRRWIPAGDVFDMHNSSPLPIPTWMHFAGPLMIGAELALNRSSFTGQDIVDPLADDGGTKFLKYLSFTAQAVMPSAPYIPGSWYWNRIAEAGRRTDPVGRTNTKTQAVLQSIGIKVSSQDPELGYTYLAREFQATARANKAQLNAAQRNYQRRIIDEKGWRNAQENYMRRQATLQALMEETFAPYVERQGQNPPPEFTESGSE